MPFSSLLLAAALQTATPAPAAPPSPPERTAEEERDFRAYSAGHKALFMCSGVFVARRRPQDILEEFRYTFDLTNAPGTAEVDYATRSAVGMDATGTIRRRAAFRDGLGCTLMAPDAGPEDIARLPRATMPQPEGDPARIAWPDGDLEASAPPGPGVDAARLNTVMTGVFDGTTYRPPDGGPTAPGSAQDAKTTGVVIVHRGRIIAERYADGWGPHTQVRTYSAAKSIASALVGVRVGQGGLSLDAPLNFPEWGPGDPRRAITLRHLLHMSSGLECEVNTLASYFGGGEDVAATAANRAYEVPPGTRFCYSNYDTISLGRAIRLSLPTLEDNLTFPRRALYLRVGMRDTYSETDAHGNFISSSQVWTTPRDLARFGLLYLHDGVWNGERILPEGWVAFSRTPITIPVNLANPRQYPWGYGAQFWLYGNHPRLPRDTYTSAGANGNYSTIIPSLDLVVVRMGLSEIRYEDFLADVVAAIDPNRR